MRRSRSTTRRTHLAGNEPESRRLIFALPLTRLGRNFGCRSLTRPVVGSEVDAGGIPLRAGGVYSACTTPPADACRPAHRHGEQLSSSIIV